MRPTRPPRMAASGFFVPRAECAVGLPSASKSAAPLGVARPASSVQIQILSKLKMQARAPTRAFQLGKGCLEDVHLLIGFSVASVSKLPTKHHKQLDDGATLKLLWGARCFNQHCELRTQADPTRILKPVKIGQSEAAD